MITFNNVFCNSKVSLPTEEEKTLAKKLLIAPLIYANHSVMPKEINVGFVTKHLESGSYHCMVTTRKVLAGEELVINYGEEYQNDLEQGIPNEVAKIKVPGFVDVEQVNALSGKGHLPLIIPEK